MCMITYNPFIRIKKAKKDIKCYKIVEIYVKHKCSDTPSNWMVNGHALTCISAGSTFPYTYEDIDFAKKNGIEYCIFYKSPYTRFSNPDFGVDAEHVDIYSEWSGIYREIYEGYHSFVTMGDALDHMKTMIGNAGKSEKLYGSGYDIIECIIPKGTEYISGKFKYTSYNNYVSSSFRPIRSLILSGVIVNKYIHENTKNFRSV